MVMRLRKQPNCFLFLHSATVQSLLHGKQIVCKKSKSLLRNLSFIPHSPFLIPD